MNNIQLSGTIAGRPHPIYDGTAIRFYLKARYPSDNPGLPPRIVDVPCRVFDPFPEQQRMLLGRKHGNIRVEAAGRLEQILSDGSNTWEDWHNNSRHSSSLEMIVNPQELFLQRGR